MIRYQLGCANDHRFESWFRDSAAFDAQVADGIVSCPLCGTDRVAKSIMAPALVGGAVRRDDAGERPPVAIEPPMLDDRQRAVRAALRELRARIVSQGEDVGSRFAEQARRMHDGDIPTRAIHGQATPREARELLDDGIHVLPLPELPEELN